MEKQIDRLLEFYKCSHDDLAKKIGISKRQLYYVRKDEHVGKFLAEKINNMVQKIESL